jgi:transcriptional regulator with XRE-family HTH domain/Zn-dependent peptidase ImmA (M78 family)
MGNFLPSRVKKVREETGLSVEKFARILGLSSEFVSLLEAGKRAPSLDTLARLSAHFNKDASFFLGEMDRVFNLLFRAASLSLGTEGCIELEHFQRYTEDYLRVEDAVGRRLQLAPPYPAGISPERLAAEERLRMGLGNEPIRDIFPLLERFGCRFLRRPFPDDVEIAGVFVFLEAQGAAFALVNSTHRICCQVLTAAHEYCHYLRDRHDSPFLDTPEIVGNTPHTSASQVGSEVDKREQFARDFSTHFLIPPAKVTEIVGRDFGHGRNMSFDDILLVKRYFGVSAQTMLRTLRSLEIINAEQYADFVGLDPIPRELAVFGASAEEFGPAYSFVSDRYKLLIEEAKQREVKH